MTTIASGTKDIIKNNSLINEALALGLISHVKLAEFIKPQLEEKIKEEIKIHTIIMAIRRYEEGLIKKQRTDYISLFNEINIKTDISYVLLNNSKLSKYVTTKNFDKLMSTSNDFYHFISYGDKTSIISNNNSINEILQDINESAIEKLYLNMVSIVLKYSDNKIGSLDIFQNIIWKLSSKNIRIITWIDKLNELVLIVNEKDVIPAYNILCKFKKSIEITPSMRGKKNIRIISKD